ETTAAGSGDTCTPALACVPLAAAVTSTSPTASASASNVALVAPGGTVMKSGSCTMPGTSAVRAICAGSFCTALMLTVNRLFAPTFILGAAGTTDTTFSACGT